MRMCRWAGFQAAVSAVVSASFRLNIREVTILEVFWKWRDVALRNTISGHGGVGWG